MRRRPIAVGAKEGQKVICCENMQGFLIDFNFDWDVLNVLKRGDRIVLPVNYSDAKGEYAEDKQCVISLIDEDVIARDSFSPARTDWDNVEVMNLEIGERGFERLNEDGKFYVEQPTTSTQYNVVISPV